MKSDFPSMEIKLPKIKAGVIKIIAAAVVVLILLVGSVYPGTVGCRRDR